MADDWDRARTDHRTRQSRSIAASALALIVEHGASGLTMAGIAAAAGISRQTLYRYYGDVDAVLLQVAELVAMHDDHFEATVLAPGDPGTQLDAFVRTFVHEGEHHAEHPAALRATLPPNARTVLDRHEDRMAQLLAGVLTAGIDAGTFRSDLDSRVDASLILGLVTAGTPANVERVVTLIHQMVDSNHEEINP